MTKFSKGDRITGAAKFESFEGETLTGVVDYEFTAMDGTPVYVVDTDSEGGRFLVASTATRVETVEPGEVLKYTYRKGGEEHFFVKVRKVEENGEVIGELYGRGTTHTYDAREIGFGPIYVGRLDGVHLTKESPAAPELSFIGPKPEPVPEPTVVLPFQVSDDDDSVIHDANGIYVGGFCGSETSSEEDSEITALVVWLLNRHFGAE